MLEEDQKLEEDLDFFHDNASQRREGNSSKWCQGRRFAQQKLCIQCVRSHHKQHNPFLLERKVLDPKNREIIYMFWDECVNVEFYKHICQKSNFIYLNGKNVVYPQVVK